MKRDRGEGFKFVWCYSFFLSKFFLNVILSGLLPLEMGWEEKEKKTGRRVKE